jgi:flavorubredoxin
MKALVIYESMYGNTAVIAEAVTRALEERGLQATVGPVTTTSPGDAVDAGLLVVGGPTHAHGMSREATRRSAASDEKNVNPEPTVSPGLREWIDRLPLGVEKLAAAFDTRFDKPVFLTGSAARGIAKRLERHGYRLVVPAKSFFVTTQNHLVDGEIESAVSWGEELAVQLGTAVRA